MFWVLWAGVWLIGACGTPESTPPPQPRAAETVSFQSADAVALKASWTPPEEGPVFLVLHGLGAGRGEWTVFSAAASRRGAGTLAFDGRGHGESGGGDYREFKTAGQWAALLKDFDAAFLWLESKGIAEERIVLGGASVGANLAVHAGLKHPRVRGLLLLSPGQVYAGIPLQPAFGRLRRPAVVAAARSDAYAYASSGSAVVAAEDPKPVFLETSAGHGVGMFEGKAGAAFLNDVLAAALTF